jgi:hypothetical protein
MTALKEEYNEVNLDTDFGRGLIKRFGGDRAKEIIVN